MQKNRQFQVTEQRVLRVSPAWSQIYEAETPEATGPETSARRFKSTDGLWLRHMAQAQRPSCQAARQQHQAHSFGCPSALFPVLVFCLPGSQGRLHVQ